jgi:hypothetical protein
MAIHLIIRYAQAALDDDWMHMSEGLAALLPDRGEDDVDFEGTSESLLEDRST